MKKSLIVLCLFATSFLYAQNKFDFDKFNDAYYYLSPKEFKGFSADVKIDLLDKIKGQIAQTPNAEQFNKIAFKIKYWGPDSSEVTVVNEFESNNPQFNAQMGQAISGIKQSIQGLVIAYGEVVQNGILNTKKYDFKVEKAGKSFKLYYKQDGMDAIDFVTLPDIVDSSILKGPQGEILGLTEFTKTNKGKKILTKMEVIMNKVINITTKFEYQQIKGYYIPKTVSAITRSPQMNVDVNIELQNVMLFK